MARSRNLNVEYRSQKHQTEVMNEINSNTIWQAPIKLEIKVLLLDLECFDFKKDPDHKPGPKFQKTMMLTMILGMEKVVAAREHLVDSLDLDVFSATVKGVRVKLLHVIAHKTDMTQICGGAGNAM